MLTISPFLVIDDSININDERARIDNGKNKHKQTRKERTKELNGSNEIHRYVSKHSILKRQMYISMN
jgi:hypothetical protein